MDFKAFRKEIGVEDGRRMTRRDYLLLLLLLAVYSIVAFVNLGALKAPQTVWTAEPGATVIVDLGETTDVSEVRFYGNIGEGTIALYDESAFVDGFFRYGETEPVATFDQDNGDMFKWKAQAFSAMYQLKAQFAFHAGNMAAQRGLSHVQLSRRLAAAVDVAHRLLNVLLAQSLAHALRLLLGVFFALLAPFALGAVLLHVAQRDAVFRRYLA